MRKGFPEILCSWETFFFFWQLAFQGTIFLKAPCFVKFSCKYFNLLYLIKPILIQRLENFMDWSVQPFPPSLLYGKHSRTSQSWKTVRPDPHQKRKDTATTCFKVKAKWTSSTVYFLAHFVFWCFFLQKEIALWSYSHFVPCVPLCDTKIVP